MKNERDVLRLRAHSAFHSALRRGEIKKPRLCSECGCKPKRFLLRAHHPDHAQPLDVEWLCSKCHGGRNLEAYLSRLFTVAEWTALIAKCKREGVSVRAQILKLLKEWADAPGQGGAGRPHE